MTNDMYSELPDVIEHFKSMGTVWARDAVKHLTDMSAEIIELRRSLSEAGEKLRDCRNQKQKIRADLIEEMARTSGCEHPTAMDFKCTICGEYIK